VTESPQIRMANDIAAQFHHRPPAEAAEEVAHHIRLFWEERMRADLLAHVADGVEADDGIDPIVIDAAELLCGDSVPQPRDGAAGELG
jgi:formate dehydrogenase subunit delta